MRSVALASARPTGNRDDRRNRQDASGAVVPGATLIVTNIQTNITTRTQSRARVGGYVIPSLAAGPILGQRGERRVSRKPCGRASRCRSPRSRASTWSLQAGQLTESFGGRRQATLLETLDVVAWARSLNQKRIVELPLNGRDYNQLALLSPGVLSPPTRPPARAARSPRPAADG